MPKLLIEIYITEAQLRDYDLGTPINAGEVAMIAGDLEDRLPTQFTATVTDDSGEIIRESE